MTEIQSIETEDEYIHVRFHDPDQYETIRTPDWTKESAESVSDGTEVRTGQTDDSDDWEVQSVLIKKNVGEEKAKNQSRKIVDKIQS